jgi:hypothetical protein
MSSTVTNFSNNINVSYPIPGVDNDTQGFRDNFASIKNALQSAASELSYLELNAVKLDSENDYGYVGGIYRGELRATGVTAVLNRDPVSVDTSINFIEGGYHKIEVDGDIILTVTNWPNKDIFSTVRFEVSNANTTTGIVDFVQSGNILKKESSLVLPHVLSNNPAVSHIFELSSADRGNTVFIKFIGTYTNV